MKKNKAIVVLLCILLVLIGVTWEIEKNWKG